MSDLRRGACPALSAPMLTGDGWLSRIALSDAISHAQLAAIAALGDRHGNGIIDISARGNLQLRGLTPDSARALEADIRTLGLPLREGLAVETGPLAGIDPFEVADPRPIAEAIRARVLRENIAQHLAAKMTVMVDGGGQIVLDELMADIRLNARTISHGVAWMLSIGGTAKSARTIGMIPQEEATQAVMTLLEKLVEAGPASRGRDLATDDLKQWLAPFLLDEAPAETVIRMAPSSTRELRNNLYAASIAPAFGQCRADAMIELCEQSIMNGMEKVRPAPDHTLLFMGTEQACKDLSAWAESHDFITSTTDPRSSIAACPGKPSCASAHAATRDMAEGIANQCGRLLDGSFTVHISGCAKGCANPAPTLLTLSATSGEAIRILHDARASDAPLVEIPAGDTVAAFRRLAELVQISRSTTETSAACIARLGPAGLKTAFTQEYS